MAQSSSAESANRGEQGGHVLSATLSMDLNCLAYLVEMGGRAPFIAIPAKLFKGNIPAGQPDLIDLGFVSHDGDDIVITDAGRAALQASREVA